MERSAEAGEGPNDLQAARPVVQYLREMDGATWKRVVSDAMAFNQYHAAQLLADPEREPDKVRRALKVSRCTYGLPWWLREAHYWRTLCAGKRKVGRPKKVMVPKENINTTKDISTFDDGMM
ncbi:MAG: hypothetical protein GY792_18295 [Gammaproteobacteria bacterium]|nr:hypothetical protein [Gammaproteobacteria bacterium]